MNSLAQSTQNGWLNKLSESSVVDVLNVLFHDTLGACTYLVRSPEIIKESTLMSFNVFPTEPVVWLSNDTAIRNKIFK